MTDEAFWYKFYQRSASPLEELTWLIKQWNNVFHLVSFRFDVVFFNVMIIQEHQEIDSYVDHKFFYIISP